MWFLNKYLKIMCKKSDKQDFFDQHVIFYICVVKTLKHILCTYI